MHNSRDYLIGPTIFLQDKNLCLSVGLFLFWTEAKWKFCLNPALYILCSLYSNKYISTYLLNEYIPSIAGKVFEVEY